MKKKSRLEKFTPIVIGTCMLSAMVSCGSSDDDDNGRTVVVREDEEQRQEGRYTVVLSPVNASIVGEATGTGEFKIDGDEFSAEIKVDGAPEGTHIQHVHVGTSCPGPESDSNGDGIIDMVEASAVTGGALIPLDDDLRAQRAGETYPEGPNYDWSESTSYQIMLADLRLPDDNTEDMLVKLDPDANLNLEGKVVEIHGIPSTTLLPATVQGSDGLSAQEGLPILCGVITRATLEEEPTPQPEPSPEPAPEPTPEPTPEETPSR